MLRKLIDQLFIAGVVAGVGVACAIAEQEIQVFVHTRRYESISDNLRSASEEDRKWVREIDDLDCPYIEREHRIRSWIITQRKSS